jgi:AcrR family transcriptional regulator
MNGPPDLDDTGSSRHSTRSSSLRQRNREALTDEIAEVALGHLATHGAAGLSLRAVAREMGMSSSAVYRYFPSRDDLLTRLIVTAYDSLGSAAEAAERDVERTDLTGRFRAIARAVRHWASAHEHQYALIYGSPVPGYRAPTLTVPPATRVPVLLVAIITDGVQAGVLPPDPHLDAAVETSLAPIVGWLMAQHGSSPPAGHMARGLMAWTYLFGAVSFDLFGHRHNVLADERLPDHPFFEYEIDRLIELVGLDPRC